MLRRSLGFRCLKLELGAIEVPCPATRGTNDPDEDRKQIPLQYAGIVEAYGRWSEVVRPGKKQLCGRFIGKLEALDRSDVHSRFRYEGELDGAKHAWRAKLAILRNAASRGLNRGNVSCGSHAISSAPLLRKNRRSRQLLSRGLRRPCRAAGVEPAGGRTGATAGRRAASAQRPGRTADGRGRCPLQGSVGYPASAGSAAERRPLEHRRAGRNSQTRLRLVVGPRACGFSG